MSLAWPSPTSTLHHQPSSAPHQALMSPDENMRPPRPPATSPRSPHTPSSSTTSPTSTVPNPSTHTHAHHVQQHHTRRHWEERVQGALRYPAYGPWGMRSMGRQPSPWMGLRTAALSPPATLPATKFAMAPGPDGREESQVSQQRGVTGVTAERSHRCHSREESQESQQRGVTGVTAERSHRSLSCLAAAQPVTGHLTVFASPPRVCLDCTPMRHVRMCAFITSPPPPPPEHSPPQLTDKTATSEG
jgi:hypothetical protein